MKTLILSMAMLFVCAFTFGQSNDEATMITESLLIMPKPGHAPAMEKAIMEHNKKFHPAGPHHAMLRYIAYGNNGGWYAWIMRGTYASLDSRPLDPKHQGDWAETVDPHVQEYGSTTIWSYNKALSTGAEKMEAATKYRAWSIILKDGQGYRFRPLMEKMKAAQESVGNAFVIYNNVINMKGGADYAIIWPFSNYAEWDEEGANIRDAYVKIHGDGSWLSFMDEWRAIVDSMDEEVREKL